MKTLIMAALILATNLAGAQTNSADQQLLAIATVKVKPGTEVLFKQAAVEILSPTRAEAGNVSYEFFQSPEDPTEFTTVEVWRSQQDLDRHMTLPHMQKFFGIVGSFFAPGYPIIKTYQKFEN